MIPEEAKGTRSMSHEKASPSRASSSSSSTSPSKRRGSNRNSSLSGSLSAMSIEAAQERSSVGLIIVKVDGSDGPVVDKMIPDYSKDRPQHSNIFVEEMLQEASSRLLECLPENNWIAPRPRDEWFSMMKGGAVAGNSLGRHLSVDRLPDSIIAGETGTADIFYLAPRASGVLTNCCFFVLHLDSDPRQQHAASSSSTIAATRNRRSSSTIRSRKKRIYGMCRRAPPHLPYSVILVSAVPCFGLLRHQFMSLTSAFFDRSCEVDHDFKAFLISICNVTTGVLHREAQTQNLDLELPVMWLVSRLGIEHVLGLVKLLLLEGRILFFSNMAYKASSAVLALLTLVPGLYNQALGDEDHATSALHGYRWKKFGMPLRIFQEDSYMLQPLLVMSQAEEVFQRHHGFLVGISNAMISKLHAAKLDAVVDLDQCQIDSQRFISSDTASEGIDLARVAFELGPADAVFIEEMIESMPSKNSPLCDTEMLEDISSSGWDGSDSWIRKHFQAYFEKFLSSAAHALHATRGANGSSWVRKAVAGLLTPQQRGFDAKLSDYNRAWVAQWTTTSSFQIWQDMYPHPCLQEELEKGYREGEPKLAVDGFSNFIYPNGDTYQGDMVGGKRHGHGTYIEHATGNTYEGDWKADLRHGKGILTTGASDFLYDGDWVNDKRTGRGHCTIRGRETFTGEWLDSKFHGQGKYCNVEGNVYEGEWVQGRKEGAGTLRAVDGEIYVGEWKAGVRCGTGQCTWPDGSVYAGEWREGKRSGEGTFLNGKTREKYEGMWWEGMRHGWGVQTCANGDVKEGEWCQDKPKDGEWKITYSNGDQFVGRCKDGRPHGYGVCKFANTDVYTGEWEYGLRSGRGQCIYASGEKFDGQWFCNQPLENDDSLQATYVVPLGEEGDDEAGRGGGGGGGKVMRRPATAMDGKEEDEDDEKGGHRRVTSPSALAGLTGPASVVYPSGDKYLGQLVEGRRHGKGRYLERATRNKYEGEWRDDLRHGHGVLSSGAHDFLYDGAWFQDRRTGQGHCTIRGRESYTGQWLDNQFHGKGKYVDSDGNTYEGEWLHGTKEGAGTLTRIDGEVYVGEWKNGNRCGMGQATFADGSTYSGEWRSNKQNGEGTLVSASGDKHEGLWNEGIRNGWGVWKSPTGDVIEGEWYLDEPKDGEWKITYSNGDQFVGRCKDGRPNGYGVCKYANGAVYTGEWVDGLRSGDGVCVFANGEVYDGLWEKDHVSLRGMGKLKFQDGRVHEFS